MNAHGLSWERLETALEHGLPPDPGYLRLLLLEDDEVPKIVRIFLAGLVRKHLKRTKKLDNLRLRNHARNYFKQEKEKGRKSDEIIKEMADIVSKSEKTINAWIYTEYEYGAIENTLLKMTFKVFYLHFSINVNSCLRSDSDRFV